MARVSKRNPPRQGSAPSAPSTRSQSHEVSEPATPRRYTRASGRAPSEESDVSVLTQKRRSRRRREDAAPIALELTTVEEAASDDDEAEEDAPGAAPQDGHVQGHQHRRSVSRPSVGGASAISGTTAKTSWSEEVVASLDNVIMAESIGPLHGATESLLKLVMPQSPLRNIVRRQIVSDGTREQRLYRHRLELFNLQKRAFGHQKYIQPSLVLRAFLGSPSLADIPESEWRPNAIIFKANLFMMLNALLIKNHGDPSSNDEFHSALETIEHAFPTAVAGGEFSNETFELSKALTVQVAIMRMTRTLEQPDPNPAGIATDSFMIDGQDGQTYRHWRAFRMESLGLPQQLACNAMITQLVNELKEPFDSASGLSPRAAIDLLLDKHSWHDLEERLKAYHDARHQELNRRIEDAGGIDAIQEALNHDMFLRSEALRAEELRQTLSGSALKPSKPPSNEAIRELKKRRQRVAVVQIPAPTAQMMQPDGEDSAIDPGLTAHLPSGGLLIPAGTDQQVQPSPSAAQHAQPARTRSFLDSQVDAHSIRFDSPPPSQPPSAPSLVVPGSSANIDPVLRSSHGKRRRENEPEYPDFDPTPDDGFQADNRDTAAADERRRRNRPSQLQDRSRPSTQPQTGGATPGPSASVPPTPSGSRRAQQSSDLDFTPAQEEPSEHDIGQNATYREYVSTMNSRNESRRQKEKMTRQPARVRAAWDDNETQALFDQIEQNGPHYATIMQDDEDQGHFSRRKAEDLRAKARNMKVDMLLGRMPLRGGWSLVILGKKEIERVHARGIPYDQARSRARGPTEDRDEEAEEE